MMEKKIEDVVNWFGECIFPQRLSNAVAIFGEDLLVECINDGLIQRSQSKIGASPTAMSKPVGYIELSNKGWTEFEARNRSKTQVKEIK